MKKYLPKLFLLLVLVSSADYAIMNVFNWLQLPGGTVRDVLNGTLLFLALMPFALFLVKAENALKQAKDELEEKVRERTSQLEEANRQLVSWTDELEQRNSEFSLLLQFGDLLQTCRTTEELSSIIKRSALQLFPSDSGVLYLYNDSRSQLYSSVMWGSEPQPEFMGPDDCWALRLGQANLYSDPEKSLPCGHISDKKRPCVCVPVAAQGETLGTLHIAIGRGFEDRQYIDARQRVAVSAAEHIGLSLQNLRLRESLREMSIRDPLTGLYNRRHMDAAFDREISKAKRKECPISVILLDIDHFKKINDEHGHEAGDAVLKGLGALLAKSVRTSDIACRYGGEEFLLILPEADMDVAYKRAEGIRLAFAKMQVQAGGRILQNFKISAGISAFPYCGENAETVIACADAALYKAKETGRDRVYVAA